MPGVPGSVWGGVAGQGERGTVNNTVKFGMFGMRHFEVSMTHLKICMMQMLKFKHLPAISSRVIVFDGCLTHSCRCILP